MTLNERNEKIEAYNQKVLSRLVSTEKSINSRFKDLSGQVFSKLKVTSYAGRDKNGNHYYYTECECGSIPKLALRDNLQRGKIPSCGCLKTDFAKKQMTTHGLSKDPWYRRACNQQVRMEKVDSRDYHKYGARGLNFGEGMETREKRILFYREHFGPEPIKGLHIDRTNNDLGYAKDNVRLVTPHENSQNKRDSHGFSSFTFDKRSRIYSTWANLKKRENLCDEWAADFKVFLADIGGKDLPKGKYLARYDVQKPFGPDNYYFSDTIQRRPSYLMPK